MRKRFILLDDGGASADRYTIFDSRPDVYGNHQFGAFDKNPYHPMGFGQHGEISHRAFEEHRRGRFRALGKSIKLEDLPENAQRFAKKFMQDSLEEDAR